jgi:hypothetical protein
VRVAAWLGHDVATLYRDYARVIEELDPADKTTATARIAAVRKSLRVIDGSRPAKARANRSSPSKQKTAHLQAV